MDEAQDRFNRRFKHHKAHLGDVRLHFVRGGQGRPLILLHGWPATWYEWHRVMPMLAEHHDVIAVDIRGLGDSSRPVGGYDKETAAADIAGLVRLLGLQSIDVAGHDIGGQIAFALARTYPDLVRRVAILDIAIPGLPEWDQSQLWHFAFHTQLDMPEFLVAGRERQYISWFFGGEAYDPSAATRNDIDEYVRTYTQPGALRAGFDYYRSFTQDAVVNRAWAANGGRLDMPVLWLGGFSAMNLPSAAQVEPAGTGTLLGRQLADVASDLSGRAISGCGHWMSTECPEVVSEELLRFFSEATKDT
ncbi:alpha/beta fold hydrolase [Glacieibacterium megasporae]|uniref:alpha/beta fold hydrolase n=1 Tax=Glacieibacterium megasporae TaxID=2835787 RepID=UPI001C1E3A69|nr:alpha/beta hydrolase [Polymorphobacter megasporae]UAJ10996.1 alpha/beta hydrolase [Polymorphobacter megasporae]